MMKSEFMLHATVLVAWLAAFLAASLLEYAPHASLWFPPAGITFASLLVLGMRALPVLWVACLLATWWTDMAYQQQLGTHELLVSGLLFAVSHTAAFGVVAVLLRRLAWTSSPLTTLSKVTTVLVGGAMAAGLSAFLGAAGLTATGLVPREEWELLIAPWWIGDYAGLLTIGPIFAVTLTKLAQFCSFEVPPGVRQFSASNQVRLPGSLGSLKLVILLVSSILILALATLLPETETVLFLLFVVMILQLWIVHTESELTSLLGIVLFSFLLVVATNFFELGDHALLLQFVIIALAANSYLGLAVPELYKDNQRLHRLLTHDALTGAMSRSFFEDAARKGLESARFHDKPASLIMVDLDQLKIINDSQGHAAGDAALRALASICYRHLQGGELLGRLSGDEFAIFVPESGNDRATELIEMIRAELGSIQFGEETIPVQASFGVSQVDSEVSDYHSLLMRADLAMYSDKRPWRDSPGT